MGALPRTESVSTSTSSGSLKNTCELCNSIFNVQSKPSICSSCSLYFHKTCLISHRRSCRTQSTRSLPLQPTTCSFSALDYGDPLIPRVTSSSTTSVVPPCTTYSLTLGSSVNKRNSITVTSPSNCSLHYQPSQVTVPQTAGCIIDNTSVMSASVASGPLISFVPYPSSQSSSITTVTSTITNIPSRAEDSCFSWRRYKLDNRIYSKGVKRYTGTNY